MRNIKLGKVADNLLKEAVADQGIVDLAPWEHDAAIILESHGLVEIVRRGPGGWPESIRSTERK